MTDGKQTPHQTPERRAITAALQANWQEAIQANQEILGTDPKNTPAYNRLGIAYLKSNQLNNAKRSFLKVLRLDPFNTIAKTNLKKTTPKFFKESSIGTILSNHTFSFIEEPGKSKVIPVTNIGEPQVISILYTGLEVELKVAARKVKVALSGTGEYIGCLPDDISAHLIPLIKAGYKYKTLIKSADTSDVQVYVREIKDSKRLKGVPSFVFENTDKLEINTSNQLSQPPLEIYDPAMESEN